jgi:ParB family chromosome partitioning protein
MTDRVGLRGRLPSDRLQDVIDQMAESVPSNGRAVDLEFHQLDVRYERLRVRQPARERRLLASLADAGQQMPIVVVLAGAAYVVVDGHKRVRCLRRLQHDTVTAVIWEMPEPEALIFRQLLHTDATDSALEQGWLLRTLHQDHGLTPDVLARRFDRSVSWVSRRLGLVRALPDAVQQRVQNGQLVAHAAMKYLVPLARANAADCVRLVEAIAPHRLTTRQIGRLYQVYITGPAPSRELVLTDPLLVLRVADDAARATVRPDAAAPEALLTDLHMLGAIARRAHRRLQHGGGLLPPERERAWRLFDQVQTDFRDLQRRCEKELRDARSGTADRDLELTGEGPRDPPDRPSLADLQGHGADRPQIGQPDGAAD